jgi:hypothetical protein
MVEASKLGIFAIAVCRLRKIEFLSFSPSAEGLEGDKLIPFCADCRSRFFPRDEIRSAFFSAAHDSWSMNFHDFMPAKFEKLSI